jgi:hypothetical protein
MQDQVFYFSASFDEKTISLVVVLDCGIFKNHLMEEPG